MKNTKRAQYLKFVGLCLLVLGHAGTVSATSYFERFKAFIGLHVVDNVKSVAQKGKNFTTATVDLVKKYPLRAAGVATAVYAFAHATYSGAFSPVTRIAQKHPGKVSGALIASVAIWGIKKYSEMIKDGCEVAYHSICGLLS